VRALLASPLGFLIGMALGAVGGGGSILAVPARVYVAGQNPHAATTTSLVVVGATALGGMLSHYRAGRVKLGPGLVFGLVGTGGSLVGAFISKQIPSNLLLFLFSFLILFAAYRMWPKKQKAVRDSEGGTGTGISADLPSDGDGSSVVVAQKTDSRTKMIVLVLVTGTVVGFLTGLFGVGGGFVIVPALVLALKYDMPEAVGTSLLVIAVNSAIALLGRVATSHVQWSIAIPFTIAGLLGSLVGRRVSDKVPTKTLAKAFVVLLLIVGAYVAIKSVMVL